MGWGDAYGYTLPGQSIDVTGLETGIYLLTIVSDPSDHLLETDESARVEPVGPPPPGEGDGEGADGVTPAETPEMASVEDVQTQLLTYLANKRQLLVFDNFEHVRAGAPIVLAILRPLHGFPWWPQAVRRSTSPVRR